MHVHSLVDRCTPLDPNSVYCNLLQCHHFASTSIVAESSNGVVGFVSGYLVPNNPEVLFVWQVAVDSSARGKGLALQMLQGLLLRESCAAVRFVHSTINPGNDASWALFAKLARTLNTNISKDVLFDSNLHFDGQHDTEILASVGPIHRQT